jgi:hypothetical protein
MKALRVLTACAAVVLALTATPVAAGDHDGWSRRSVFPRPLTRGATGVTLTRPQ